MLSISPAQLQTLDRLQVGRFADALVDHVAGFAPVASQSLGPQRVRQTIVLGLHKAEGHGFRRRGPARFFVELMFMLGSHFDSDPQYRSLTAGSLQPDEPDDDLSRADRLHAAVLAYAHAASGPGHVHERAAMARIGDARFSHLQNLAARPAADSVALLAAVHPEKVASVGRPAIEALVQSAWQQAACHEPQWADSGPLFAGLMFTFGHGCLADPQYPWISAALEGAVGDAAVSAPERLFRKFRVFLDHASLRLEAR